MACVGFVAVFCAFLFVGPISGVVSLAYKKNKKTVKVVGKQ